MEGGQWESTDGERKEEKVTWNSENTTYISRVKRETGKETTIKAEDEEGADRC